PPPPHPRGPPQPLAPPPPLYERILGESFQKLPNQIRDLHTPNGVTKWSGTARVARGTRPLSALSGFLLGLPAAKAATPVTVTFTPQNNGELWERNFGGKKFHSFQAEGTGRNSHLLTERFGSITVSLALVLKNGELDLIPRRWAFLSMPMPTAHLPQGRSFESAHDDTFTFNVQFKTPLTGLIATYQGTLAKQ
ncbi:MAG: DUF4166 domain-containing protein, partial [Amylibacter sp.]